jgi:hypothetical protein
MPSTKAKITEQVQRLYARYVDRENISPVAYKEEISLIVEQSINAVLQAVTVPSRKINRCEIPQSSLVKYNVTVTSDIATMPAFPISLEHDMGLWEIVNPASPLTAFIPIPMQLAKVMQGTIVSNLENQVGFYRYGDKVHFLSTPGAATVDMYLLVSDLSQLGANDPLPLSAGYESEVIMKCLQTLGAGAFAQQELASINNAEDSMQKQL